MTNQTVEIEKPGRTDLFLVNPLTIDAIDGFNVRKDMGDLNELANSIYENGMKTPMLLRRNKDTPGRFFIIEGHRRKLATEILYADGRWTPEMGIQLRAIFETKASNDYDRLVDMAITNTGKPFTPIEFAELVRRLRAYGKTDAEIAKRLGKSITTISNTTFLLELPEEIKTAIGLKKLSANLAIQTIKSEGTEIAYSVLKELITENVEEEAVVAATPNTEVPERKMSTKKVTKASVEKKTGKYNSISFFKKMNENSPVKVLEEMKRTHSIVNDILSGKLSEEDIYTLFYEGSA